MQVLCMAYKACHCTTASHLESQINGCISPGLLLQEQGAVEVLCGAAGASGEEQRPAAACLANLCSDHHLLPHIASNPATIPALTTLSQSPIRDVQVSCSSSE